MWTNGLKHCPTTYLDQEPRPSVKGIIENIVSIWSIDFDQTHEFLVTSGSAKHLLKPQFCITLFCVCKSMLYSESCVSTHNDKFLYVKSFDQSPPGHIMFKGFYTITLRLAREIYRLMLTSLSLRSHYYLDVPSV